MIVYQYGLRAPTSQIELIHDQLWLSHRYRNTLVEIERGRRAAVRRLNSTVGNVPLLEQQTKEAGERVSEASKAVKQYRSKNRTRKVPEWMRTELDAARLEKKDVATKLREVRKQLRTPEIQAEMDRINGLAGELRRSARAHCGLYWGSYLLVEDEMASSSKSPLYDKENPNEPNDPGFVRWHGEGHLGVQIQGGMPTGLVQFHSTLLQIKKVDPVEGKLGKSHYLLRMRVGSNGRKPIWGEWPMVMHRPLDPGQIKGAAVSCRRIGLRWQWTVEITVDKESGCRPRPCGYGQVAVNFGWRKVDGGIRVAYAVDYEGNEQELVLPDGEAEGIVRPSRVRERLTDEQRAIQKRDGLIYGKACRLSDDGKSYEAEKVLSGRPDLLSRLSSRVRPARKPPILPALRKSDELRSIRDQRFGHILQSLIKWLKTIEVPCWLKDRTSHIHKWKSQNRLRKLIGYWRSNRFDGDETMFQSLEVWNHRDEHLLSWEDSQRKKSQRRRRDLYRVWAAKLADRYYTIVLNSHDMAETARKPKVEATDDIPLSRSNRQLVSPSELKEALINAKRSREGQTVENPAQKVTHTCHNCETEQDFDAASSIEHTCLACGETWDQDRNAAINSLRWFVERPSDAKILGTARKIKNLDENGVEKETRRQRISRLKREKDARMKALANDAASS